jgi:protein TonB
MFNTLLESKAKTQRSIGGSFVSVAMHATIIVLAIQATLHADQPKVQRETEIEYAEVKKDEPPPSKPVVQIASVAPIPKGFQTLTAPVNIPDVLPQIDLSQQPTDELDWVAKGVPGGRNSGTVATPPSGNQIYLESQVEKPVMPLQGSASPRYPEVLKAAGIQGEVIAAFVVDTTGRADPASFKVVTATNDLFGAAVRTALPGMRFLPAEIGGKKVKQQVQQPFVFTIVK